ncbi:MAG: hypothetical protein ACI3X3_04915 [Acidaminococcus sp.]|uniref:hypothetical protein n=1 Tax=Acidaminococcus sp. TaxID=1872103 RepID=UPI003F14F5E5
MNILHDFFEIPTENHLSISLNEILYKNEKILWQGKPTGKHLVQDSEKITTGISFIIYFVGELILLYKLLFAFSLSILLFFFFWTFWAYLGTYGIFHLQYMCRKRTWYLVTSCRILLIYGNRYVEYPYGNLNYLVLKTWNDGIGTIYFKEPPVLFERVGVRKMILGEHTTELAAIYDAEAVYQLIKETKANINCKLN